MGPIRFEGVRFIIYSEDHLPAHVHCNYVGVEIIVELIGSPDPTAALARRRDAVRPFNAKQSDVNYLLRMAEDHAEELLSFWRRIHG